jgi:hypothetical protein
LFIDPDALVALRPRKYVQKHRADPNDGDHQDCGGQNNVSHDNASSVVVARAQIDAGNLGFWRQIAVRLRQLECAGLPKTKWARCEPPLTTLFVPVPSPNSFALAKLPNQNNNSIKDCQAPEAFLLASSCPYRATTPNRSTLRRSLYMSFQDMTMPFSDIAASLLPVAKPRSLIE